MQIIFHFKFQNLSFTFTIGLKYNCFLHFNEYFSLSYSHKCYSDVSIYWSNEHESINVYTSGPK